MPNVQLIFVMGVSGSGKTTLGKGLAQVLNYVFLDADDFHSELAVAKMRSGVALSDNERGPWMEKITNALATNITKKQSTVMAISGLTQKHRALLRALTENIHMFVLQVAKPILVKRLSTRAAHFFPVSLLDSQLATQEPVSNEAGVMTLDGDQPIDDLIQQCLRSVNEAT